MVNPAAFAVRLAIAASEHVERCGVRESGLGIRHIWHYEDARGIGIGMRDQAAELGVRVVLGLGEQNDCGNNQLATCRFAQRTIELPQSPSGHVPRPAGKLVRITLVGRSQPNDVMKRDVDRDGGYAKVLEVAQRTSQPERSQPLAGPWF